MLLVRRSNTITIDLKAINNKNINILNLTRDITFLYRYKKIKYSYNRY